MIFIMKLSKRDQKLVSAERLKATGRLASEIAHELNTPLGGILMYSHLLLEDIDEEEERPLEKGTAVTIKTDSK